MFALFRPKWRGSPWSVRCVDPHPGHDRDGRRLSQHVGHPRQKGPQSSLLVDDDHDARPVTADVGGLGVAGAEAGDAVENARSEEARAAGAVDESGGGGSVVPEHRRVETDGET
jgi:hypothetical protein